jgi:hypothetical protein
MKLSIVISNEANRQQAITSLQELPIDVPMVVSITEYRKNRSLAQNKLLHAWITKIAEHWRDSTGQVISMEAWKEYLKRTFLGYEVVALPNASYIELTRKTSTLNTKEFTEFLELIDAYAVTDLNLILPHPDDLYYEAMGLSRG